MSGESRDGHGKLIALIVAVVVIFGALAIGPPIVRGWHLGYNSSTDNACETRLGLQWCGHRAREGASESNCILEGNCGR